MEKVSLADFVESTLVSISDGVRRAQAHSKANDGIPIAPGQVDGTPLHQGDQLVRFQLTVEAGHSSGHKGSLEAGATFLAVVSGRLGVEKASERKNASHQVIEFSIPMHFQHRWASAVADERAK